MLVIKIMLAAAIVVTTVVMCVDMVFSYMDYRDEYKLEKIKEKYRKY